MNESAVKVSRLIRASAEPPEVAILGVLGATDSLFFAESPGRILRDRSGCNRRLYLNPIAGAFRYVCRPWGGAVHYLLHGLDNLTQSRSIAVYGVAAADSKLGSLVEYLDKRADYELIVATGERSPHYIGAVNELGERFWSQRYITQGVASIRYAGLMPHERWQSSRIAIISTQLVETLVDLLRATASPNVIVQLHENEILRLVRKTTVRKELLALIPGRVRIVSMNLRELMQLAQLLLGEAALRPLEYLSGFNRVLALQDLLCAVADQLAGTMLTVSVGHRGVAFAVSHNGTTRQWYMRGVVDKGAFGVGAGDHALARMTDQLLRIDDAFSRSTTQRTALRGWTSEEVKLLARAFLIGGAEGVYWPDPFTRDASEAHPASRLVDSREQLEAADLTNAQEVLPASVSWRAQGETSTTRWADSAVRAELERMFFRAYSPDSEDYQK